MAQRFAQPWVRTSVNLSPEFHKLCREHRIKFSDAIRVGISITLAERGVKEYDNNLNIMRRITKLKNKLEEVSQKYHELKENTTSTKNSSA